MLLKDLLEGDILISHMKSQNTDSVSGLVNQTICLCKAPDSTPGRVGIFNDTAHKHHMFPLVSANDLTARERESKNHSGCRWSMYCPGGHKQFTLRRPKKKKEKASCAVLMWKGYICMSKLKSVLMLLNESSLQPACLLLAAVAYSKTSLCWRVRNPIQQFFTL